MSQRIKAIYRKGGFFVLEPCDIPEESEVELIVEGPIKIAPEITDRQEAARVLAVVTERMRRNPLPQQAPRFTREELHERS